MYMTTKQFLASCAKATFALAAVVMMSAVLTSCSKDNDDEPKANTVTIDGVERPIVKAEYKDENDGNYILYLHLSAESTEVVGFYLNKDLHMTGKPIDLTKKEPEHDGKYYWTVDYYDADGKRIINAFGAPGNPPFLFTTGTLTMSGSFENINIRLENGRVMGKDGKEHTLTISYSGTMTKEQ